MRAPLAEDPDLVPPSTADKEPARVSLNPEPLGVSE